VEDGTLSKANLEEAYHTAAIVEVENTPANDYQHQTVEVEQGRGNIWANT
jgi:hypothetical protein